LLKNQKIAGSQKAKSGLNRKEKRRIRRSNYDGFLELFRFFLQGYRYEIIDFCGSPPIKVIHDAKAYDAKFCFTAYNNGEYSAEDLQTKGIKTKHPNILQAVITGKKGWGLWLQQWTDGIAECNFTENEILDQFKENGIKIPDSLLQDFQNTWRRKRNELL
jgi:hypothetical protein